MQAPPGMQHDFRSEVIECCRRAERHRESAEAAIDPRVVTDYLLMERNWLVLAGNYEFIQQLSAFILGHDPTSFRRDAANRPREARAKTL